MGDHKNKNEKYFLKTKKMFFSFILIILISVFFDKKTAQKSHILISIRNLSENQFRPIVFLFLRYNTVKNNKDRKKPYFRAIFL